MSDNKIAATYPGLNKDDLLAITGAGGFQVKIRLACEE